MKQIFIIIFLSVICFFKSIDSYSQNFDQPGAYMTYMSQQYKDINSDIWSYTSAVAHGKTARKIENRRAELLKTVKTVINKINAMSAYKGDNSLRDSAVAYLKLTYHILNEDYAEIVNMEEVAEQSYDAMEAYMLAQDLASEKQRIAADMLETNQVEFAKKYNVNLIIAEEDKLQKKLAIASKVNAYHRKIYLIFFKSYKQELYLLEAINSKNISGVEQNKKSLLQYTNEGILKLDTMKAYNEDGSVITSCQKLLNFYRDECQEKISIYTNYFLQVDNFEKTQKIFNEKKPSERTQEDVDYYNKAVKEYNEAIGIYNKVNDELNKNRAILIDNYNKTTQNFFNKHTPKHR